MQTAQCSAGRCSISPIVKGSKRGPFLSGRRVFVERPSQHARRQRRHCPAQPQAVFDYCATQGNMVESTARSWRAAGLLLMRQTVDQENRKAIVRGTICLIYLVEICLWVVIMVAMPAMVNDPNIAITSAQTGTLLAMGTAGSTIGKGVAAAIMDAIDPRIGMIGVLLTVAAFNSAFALSNGLLMFCFFWGVGRIFHSSGWVAATRLICTWTPEEERGAALGQLSFASRLGFMLGGAGLGGLLLMGYSWRFVFQFVSVAAVLCAAVLTFLVPAAAPHSLTSEDGASHADYCITVPRDNRPKVSAASGEGRVLQADTAWGRSKGVSSQQQAQDSGVLGGAAPDASTATSQKAAVKEFASDAQVWCAIIGRCLLHLVFEFQAFLNLYVQQVLSISAGAAAQVAAGYSFGSAIAVFGGGLIYVKLSGSGRRNLVVTLCAVQAVGLWLLLQTTSRIPVVTLITLLGTAMSLPYYVPGPAYNLRRGGNFSAVLEGVTEMAAFGCAIVFDLAVGKVLPTAGWNGVIKMLLVCAVAGTAVMAVFMQQEKRVVDQQNQMKAAVA